MSPLMIIALTVEIFGLWLQITGPRHWIQEAGFYLVIVSGALYLTAAKHRIKR